MTEAGLLAEQQGYYWLKTGLALGMLAAVIVVALLAGNIALLAASAVLLAVASTQLALLSHDVGHNQGFRGRRRNRLARLFFGSVVLGVSHSWWTQKHNQHHASPNHVELDPDIDFPIIVFDPDQVAARPRFVRPLFAVQAFLFAALLPFQAVMLYVSSVLHLLSGRAPHPLAQGAGMLLHFALYGWLLVAIGGPAEAALFAALHMVFFGIYNSSVFASNHKGMPTLREGERLDFLREQVLTSRNLRPGRFADLWYGGLNLQIEHHLFPTMPRNNLSKARPIVRAFCEREDIKYHETSIWEAYHEGFAHLHRVGTMVRRGFGTGPAET